MKENIIHISITANIVLWYTYIYMYNIIYDFVFLLLVSQRKMSEWVSECMYLFDWGRGRMRVRERARARTNDSQNYLYQYRHSVDISCFVSSWKFLVSNRTLEREFKASRKLIYYLFSSTVMAHKNKIIVYNCTLLCMSY